MKRNAKMTLLMVVNIFIFVVAFLFGSLALMFVSGISAVISMLSKNREERLKNSYVFLIMAIVNFFFCKWISAIIFLIEQCGFDQKEKNSKSFMRAEKRPQDDSQVRKIDILLKFGVVLIFIAGFVFATTGWYSLNAILKIFIFLSCAVLFIGLSKFCEQKIKIKSTIYLYWILGMGFILLIFFVMGYSSLFGDYFSLIGSGQLLYVSFCCLVGAILALISYNNFKDKAFLYLVYSAIVLSVLFLTENLELAVEEILILLIPIATIIKLFKMNKKSDIYTLSIFSDILLIILGIAFICFSMTYTNSLAVVALSILFIYNIYSYIYLNKKSDLNAFASALSYISLIPSLILLLDGDSCSWVLVTTVFVTFLYMISFLFNNEELKNSSLITADIIIVLAFVISTSGPSWLPLSVALLSALVCVLCTFIDNLDKYDIEAFVHPIKISMLLFGVFFLLNGYFGLNNVIGYWLSFTLLIYILVYCLTRRKVLMDIYEKFSVVAIIICLIFTTAISNLIVSVVIFVSIVLFYAEVNWTKDVSMRFKNSVFLLLLFNILISTKAIENSLEIVNSNYLYSNIISLILFVAIAIFHYHDEFKFNLSLFAIIIPIISLIETYTDIEWVSTILPSIFVYYLTFIISRLIKNNKTIKDVVGYIGYAFAFLLVIFNDNYYVLAYSFFLIVLSLLLGYYDKNYNALFKVATIALIVTVFYQLQEFWKLIPAWLYLLFGGIILVVFATYKQLKIINSKKDEKK